MIDGFGQIIQPLYPIYIWQFRGSLLLPTPLGSALIDTSLSPIGQYNVGQFQFVMSEAHTDIHNNPWWILLHRSFLDRDKATNIYHMINYLIFNWAINFTIWNESHCNQNSISDTSINFFLIFPNKENSMMTYCSWPTRFRLRLWKPMWPCMLWNAKSDLQKGEIVYPNLGINFEYDRHFQYWNSNLHWSLSIPHNTFTLFFNGLVYLFQINNICQF